MDKTYKIREMKIEDVDECLEVHHSLFPVKYSKKEITDDLQSEYLALLLTTTEDGKEKIIGVSMSRRFWTSKFSYNRSSYLATFGILENYRKKGLGSFLLRFTCKIIGNYYNCSHFSLHMLRRNDLLQFYEKSGFEAVQVLPEYYNFTTPRPDAVIMQCDPKKVEFNLNSKNDIEIEDKLNKMLNEKQKIGWFDPWFSKP